MTVCQKISHLLDKIMVGLAWFSGLLMIFSLISVCVDVLLRYFFNRPSGWVLQISEYILLYIPFLASAYVLKTEGHIRVDIVLNLLGRRRAALLNTVTSVLGAGVLFVLAYYGTWVTVDLYVRKVPTLKYLKIPEFLVVMVIPLGCLLFGLQFVRRAAGYFRKFRQADADYVNGTP